MKKKFIILGIAFVMLFSLAACNDFDLAGYKAEAKTEIENYATESNYCTENWSIVCGIVEAGKQVVDAAESKFAVDTAVSTVKDEIDEVGIQLTDELRLEILRLYHSWAVSEFSQNAPSWDELEKWSFACYYGQYSGFYVFQFGGWRFGASTEEFIDGLNFSRPGWNDIYTFRDDVGGTLKEIYEGGYLTRSELEEIHSIHIVFYADNFPFRND